MDNSKKYHWYKIADSENELQFSPNNLLQIEVAGKKICIAKTKQGLNACTSKCPHAGGNIAEGFLDALDNVVCPVHRYKFNLQNGRDVTAEGYYLKIYPIEVREGEVFIGIEEGGLFSWFK